MDKILIVDNIKNTELLRNLLINDTCEIYTSQSGYNALAKVKMFHPDLIIMETNLTDISGYDICKTLKESSKTQDIIILLLSSSDFKQAKLKAFEVGADDFLEKNFDSFILISKVKSLLRIKYLRKQLQEKYAQLEETNNILDTQLKMAQRLQHSLIPEINTKFGNVGVYSKYLPAMYIGGDFYDVINLKKDCVCIILGDVSGHGISAALLTAMLNNMIRNIVERHFDPDKVLYFLNQEFISTVNTNEIYACVFIAIIDTAAHKIFYSNAGQPSPIFVSGGKTKELLSTGTPIGLMNNSQYENKVINYEHNDKIFFHTDGLENNFYKDDPDGFVRDLNKILCESSDDELMQNILNQFYYGDVENKYEADDVSVIICSL